MFETLFAAFALVLIIEGLLPFAFPHFWKKMMSEASAMPKAIYG
ncbi:DUF2065 domain-containing protein YjeT (fragment) [uncultured Thiomicrorhabdus sp.]